MTNIYKLLNISFDSDAKEIRKALTLAAKSNLISLEDRKKVSAILFNSAKRMKYDEDLKAQEPEFFESVNTTQKLKQALFSFINND